MLTWGWVLIRCCSFKGFLRLIFNCLGLRSHLPFPVFQVFESELCFCTFLPVSQPGISSDTISFSHTLLFILLSYSSHLTLSSHLLHLLLHLISFFTISIWAVSPCPLLRMPNYFQTFPLDHSLYLVSVFFEDFRGCSFSFTELFSWSHGLCYSSPVVCFLSTNKLRYCPFGSTAQGKSTSTNPSTVLRFQKAFAQIKSLFTLPASFSGVGGIYETKMWSTCRHQDLRCFAYRDCPQNVMCPLWFPPNFLPHCFLGVVVLPEYTKMGGEREKWGVCVCVGAHSLTNTKICIDGNLKLVAMDTVSPGVSESGNWLWRMLEVPSFLFFTWPQFYEA